MTPHAKKRGTGGLVLQVSPCITLGLLLVAALSSRAAGLPCELPSFLPLSTTPAQLSASTAGQQQERELLPPWGFDSITNAPSRPLLAANSARIKRSILAGPAANVLQQSPSHPRAP